MTAKKAAPAKKPAPAKPYKAPKAHPHHELRQQFINAGGELVEREDGGWSFINYPGHWTPQGEWVPD